MMRARAQVFCMLSPLLLLLGGCGKPSGGEGTKVKWEYCWVQHYGGAHHQRTGPGVPVESYRLTLPGQSEKHSSKEEIAAALGSKKKIERPTDLLNILGQDGWELVSVVERSDTTEWMLKRPVR